MTAAYMQILIHAVNSSLFPDANPNSVTWTGPPPEIVTVQSLLYASLATSLFAAFIAMLGKQWINRYLRNHGGSSADKSRDRQQKLDGFNKWHFHLVIESLPVILQLALLLLGCALSRYLWTISRTVAGVIVAMTLFGFTSYIFFTLAATLYYNCPYQTPPSILARTVTRYLAHSDAAFARSLRPLIGSFPSIKSPGRILGRLRPGVRSVLRSFGCVPAVGKEAEYIPLAVVVTPPTRAFEDIPIDWEVCTADVRCVYWVLNSTTEIDVIFSTVRFATDMIWYPEIAGALSPHVLADLFFDCLADGRVIPGKSEHASSIGMALASVLSTRLCMEPEGEGLGELCERLLSQVRLERSPESMFSLAVAVLRLVSSVPTRDGRFTDWYFFRSTSTVHKLWLSRVTLQTIWRWRSVQGPARVLDAWGMASIRRTLVEHGDQMPDTLKTNVFLILTISLGLQIDIRDLYPPNNKCGLSHSFRQLHSLDGSDTLKTAIRLFHRELQRLIAEGADPYTLTSVLSMLVHLDPFQAMGSGELGFSWITEILNSGYQEDQCERLAGEVVKLLAKHFFHKDPVSSINVEPAWISPLLRFLLLSEKLETVGSTQFVALRILAISPGSADFGPMILPILTSSLLPIHPPQARHLALSVFLRFMSGWFSPQMEDVASKDLEKFVQTVGDPFQLPDLPLQDGKPVHLPYYNPKVATAVLIEFASSDLWQNHLRRSNFTSFEETVSTQDGKRTALRGILEVTNSFFPEFLRTGQKIAMAIKRLEELRCLNTAEVVIMWAWTVGAVNPVDHDGWQLIERDTLRFYKTRGVEHLTVLRQHFADRNTFISSRVCRESGTFVELPVLKLQPEAESRHETYLNLSQACRSRRLHQLLGYDPTAWKEAIAVEEVDEKTEVSSGHYIALVPFMDWACDYP